MAPGGAPLHTAVRPRRLLLPALPKYAQTDEPEEQAFSGVGDLYTLKESKKVGACGPFTVKPKFLRFVRHAIRHIEREHAPAKMIIRNT